uniref:Uncharacterized protein n=1 Tax=Lepeophtheirus salmonis TaxID=72036 RepID=A0A0K2SYV7_LEPSM
MHTYMSINYRYRMCLTIRIVIRVAYNPSCNFTYLYQKPQIIDHLLCVYIISAYGVIDTPF